MENNEQIEKKSKFDFSKYGKVISFLALEIIAIISFSLGNSFILYTSISVVLFVLLLLVTWVEIKKEGYPTFAFFLIPILAFGLFCVISNFNKDVNYSLSGGLSAFVPIGLVVFPCCGYLLAHEKNFKISQALLVIFVAIGVYTFINFIGTMIQFSPFHTLRYADKYLFYNGEIVEISVGNMAYALIGFRFQEVSIEYYLMYPIILLVSGIFLFFIKYKDNKKLFITYACLTGLAFISILFSITKFMAIILALLIYICVLILLTAKKVLDLKYTRIIFIIMGAITGLVVLVFLLNAQAIAGSPINFIQDLISGNGFLNRVFNGNRLALNYNIAADGLFSKFKLNGIITGSIEGYTNTYDFYEYYHVEAISNTNSFFFDTILTSGTIGLLFLIIVVGFIIYSIYKYCINSRDLIENKAVITAFVSGFFIYSFVAYDMAPMIFKSDLFPFYTNNLFIISLILVGYMNVLPLTSEAVKNETPIESTIMSKGGDNDEISF